MNNTAGTCDGSMHCTAWTHDPTVSSNDVVINGLAIEWECAPCKCQISWMNFSQMNIIRWWIGFYNKYWWWDF